MKTDYPHATWIGAHHYTPATRGTRDISNIIIHDAEFPRIDGAARGIARYFAQPTAGGSTHYVVDNRQVIQCVMERDVCWGAPGANHNGIHIEIPGYADGKWTGIYCSDTFNVLTGLIINIARRYKIPLVKLSPTNLRDGIRGIAGHSDVSSAFGRTNHTDPGPGFPWSTVIGLCTTKSPGHPTNYLDDAPSRPVTVGGVTFNTYFPHWVTLLCRQRFWAETIALQWWLNRNGCALTLDGMFGPKTYGGVCFYQRKHELSADGVVGPVTARRIGLTS